MGLTAIERGPLPSPPVINTHGSADPLRNGVAPNFKIAKFAIFLHYFLACPGVKHEPAGGKLQHVVALCISFHLISISRKISGPPTICHGAEHKSAALIFVVFEQHFRVLSQVKAQPALIFHME